MRLRGVGKRYGRGAWVLADVDVDLAFGETTAFIGGNGSGKSTLLRILVGVTRPTTGTMLDRPVVVGYIPDRFPPDERMTARSYLTHMGRLRGLTTREAERRAGELLDRLALVGGMETPLRRLSKGNAQKIAVAQALLVSPQLLVLDEPWSGLDSSAHGVLAEIMNEVTQNGGTVVFTDHREAVVQANATTVYRIAEGRVTLSGPNARPAPLMETRVVLQAPLDNARISSTPDWRALEGVLAVRTEDSQVTIHVARAHADQLVLTALHDGWSMVEVCQVSAAQGTIGPVTDGTTRGSAR